MDSLPPFTEPEYAVSVRAERLVRQYQLRRPAIVLLASLVAIVSLCIALNYWFTATQFQSLLAEKSTEIGKVETQLGAHRTSLNTNEQLLAANDANRGSLWGRVLTRYVFGVPITIIAVVKNGTSPIDEYKKYNDWRKETRITDAQLKTQQSQLRRDISTSEQKQSTLAVERRVLASQLESRYSVRNWLMILCIAFGAIAFIAFRARTTQTIYSVITAFDPAPPILTAESTIERLLPIEQPALPSSTDPPNNNAPMA